MKFSYSTVVELTSSITKLESGSYIVEINSNTGDSNAYGLFETPEDARNFVQSFSNEVSLMVGESVSETFLTDENLIPVISKSELDRICDQISKKLDNIWQNQGKSPTIQ